MQIRSMHKKMDLFFEKQIKTFFELQVKQFIILKEINFIRFIPYIKLKST